MGGTALQQGVDQINFTQSSVGAARTPTSERVKQVPDGCKAALAALAARLGTTPDTLGIAVGIQSGQVKIGEFSTVRSDFTAIGCAGPFSDRWRLTGLCSASRSCACRHLT